MRPIVALLAGAVAALASSTAFAADMPVKAAQRVVAPAFSWTGLYLGANLGYGWARVNSTNTIVGNGVLGAGTSTDTGNLNGINGGGQIGFNYQTGMIVWASKRTSRAPIRSRPPPRAAARAARSRVRIVSVRSAPFVAASA